MITHQVFGKSSKFLISISTPNKLYFRINSYFPKMNMVKYSKHISLEGSTHKHESAH